MLNKKTRYQAQDKLYNEITHDLSHWKSKIRANIQEKEICNMLFTLRISVHVGYVHVYIVRRYDVLWQFASMVLNLIFPEKNCIHFLNVIQTCDEMQS